MIKVIIDTNVLVSALIQRSYPFYIVDKILAKESFQLCLSQELFEEYIEVLKRKKFSKFPEFFSNAQLLLASMESVCKMYKPKIKLNILSDKDDNKILELADVSKAGFIITGDINDFTIDCYKETKIVSPKEFWGSHLI